MRLETERLCLREMTPDDFDELYTVLADSDIMQHYPYTFDEARVRNWINKNRERYRVFGFGLWAVCLKTTGEMIGDCGLTMQNIGGTILPEIGYHIAKAYQNRGYAKEAARAVRDWTFANTTFDVVYSYMKKANVPSSAVARANGMALLDEFTDDEGEQTVIYGISREESTRHMDIWERLYQRAKNEYHPEEVSPFIEAHHVVCALESEDGTIYTGFCIEACSGVMNLCAERVAALNMYIDAEDGLELPSIVLLEQLRTVDKRRLGSFIGHLSEKHICGINHALAVSIGLIESVPKQLILCLCSTCADNFYGTGAYSLRRIDPQQIEKDTCTYCNQRKGYDYELIPKKR